MFLRLEHILCTKPPRQTFSEMEDTAVSVFEYHVVSSVPDFQTKPAESQPTRRVLICRFKNGGGVKWKKCPPTHLHFNCT
jgi:hypothetical protein